MATVSSIFLLNPTFNSVLGECARHSEPVQMQTARDLELGQVSGGTQALVPPSNKENAWDGCMGWDLLTCRQSQYVHVCEQLVNFRLE